MISDYSQLAADARKDNRDVLMAALVKLQIVSVTVEYSGSGDSGDFSGVTVEPAEVLPTLRTEQVEVFYAKPEWQEGVGYVYTRATQHKSVYDALTDFAMDWVSAQHGGWENNDGGQGTVTMVVADNTVTLDHTEFFTESCSYEYSC